MGTCVLNNAKWHLIIYQCESEISSDCFCLSHRIMVLCSMSSTGTLSVSHRTHCIIESRLWNERKGTSSTQRNLVGTLYIIRVICTMFKNNFLHNQIFMLSSSEVKQNLRTCIIRLHHVLHIYTVHLNFIK